VISFTVVLHHCRERRCAPDAVPPCGLESEFVSGQDAGDEHPEEIVCETPLVLELTSRNTVNMGLRNGTNTCSCVRVSVGVYVYLLVCTCVC